MNYNNTFYKTTRVLIWQIWIVFFGFATSMAQTSMTKIKDGTVLGTTAEPNLGAILELESESKGFLVPRLNTLQRDAIVSSNRTDGLMIYNKDSGCFNYWSVARDTWLSLCGTPEPAELEIESGQCEKTKVHGTFKQGVYLGEGHYITIPVEVTKAGIYKAKVFTTNGYHFIGEGEFVSPGRYVISLNGLGIPSKGHNNSDECDVLTISLNSKVSSCVETKVCVEKADVSYTINCNDAIQVQGEYFSGKELTSNEKMILTVDVKQVGFWDVKTNKVNGIYFKGSGEFTTTGSQDIELFGVGTPKKASNSNVFTLTSNSDKETSCSSNSVVVKGLSYTVDCENITVNGTYKEGESLTDSHNVVVSVNVKAIGSTVIESNTKDGISFSSGQIVFSRLGVQEVILKAKGVPVNSGVKQFTISSSEQQNVDALCGFDIDVQALPVRYTVDCSSLVSQGSYRPKTLMNEDNFISVSLDVQQPGAYELVTDQQNGVLFKAKGTFISQGRHDIILQAEGTPISSGIYQYKIKSRSGEELCNISIGYSRRIMNVLGLGSKSYQPGSATNKESVRAILQASDNFGYNGTVGIDGFNIIDGGDRIQGEQLKALINSKKIDIIIIGYNYWLGQESIAVLKDFITKKKGVLIHAQEKEEQGVKSFINAISHSANTTVSSSNPTITNPIVNIANPILEGPFGDVKGKEVGADLNNSLYVSGFSNDFISLAHQKGDATRSWLLKHKTLGYFFIGDAGWLAGDISQRVGNRWPAAITAKGVPVKKVHSGGIDIYNSILYANIMAWAVEYVDENIDQDFQLN